MHAGDVSKRLGGAARALKGSRKIRRLLAAQELQADVQRTLLLLEVMVSSLIRCTASKVQSVMVANRSVCEHL